MAKVSDKQRGGFDIGETGGGLSGLLADDEELDRPALWRLGTWAALSVGAVIVALLANQSSIGMRRDQSASVDLLKQAQQLQLTAKESQNEARRLASAIDTLNSDRDRLYSRVAVLEQGLDSVTGAITRPGPASSSAQAAASPAGPSQTGQNQTNPGQPNPAQSSPAQGSPAQASAGQGGTNQTAALGNQGSTGTTVSTSPSPAETSSPAPAPAANLAVSTTPSSGPTASMDPQAPIAKSSAVPAVATVAATAPALTDKGGAVEKQDKASSAAPVAPEPAAKSGASQQAPSAQPSGSLVASKSMMGPPDPAAGKLIEPVAPAKAVIAAPLPDIAAIAPKASDEAEAAPVSAVPELVAPRTDFGVDVGGANSISGLRALWRGLLRSRSNGALAKLRPIIVIKENNNGLGMQLRLVAGPINDAAAAAKICASLTVVDRGCTTAVFEGQRLALGADDAGKTGASKSESAMSQSADKPAQTDSRPSSRRHYYSAKHPRVVEEAPPKPEPSTLSRLFGRRE